MHLRGATERWDPFPATRHYDDTGDRLDAHRAIGVSAAGLAAAGLVEGGIALLSGSAGLLGDALHNLSDVSTSVVVFASLRISKRPASPSHPYGYERAEDLAGLAVALVIWASAVFAAVVSVHKLTGHGHTRHVGLGLAAAVVGIAGNQLVAHYKRRVGQRIHSTTLIADAKHSWLDALSSAGAFCGLLGVALGLPWADGVAGLVVTGFIVHVGIEVTHELVGHLMDSVAPALIAAAEEAALGVEGVEHAHVRARWIGRSLLVEVEGFVAAGTTIEAAEALGWSVDEAVTAAVPVSRAVQWYPRAMPD
jgi:cation diffusion facilitator family transporter